MKNDWEKAEKILKNDGIGVVPTDTLYGLVGRALSKKVVKKIYKIKERNTKKPLILLINSYKDLDLFGIEKSIWQAKILEKFWPGQVSIIFPCKLNKWGYLHRGINSIAFRMVGPKNKNLYKLIQKVGPLVAPSVNKEGDKPAETIKEARNYFNGSVDFYISVGKRISLSSTLIKIDNNKKIKILRQGNKKIEV